MVTITLQFTDLEAAAAALAHIKTHGSILGTTLGARTQEVDAGATKPPPIKAKAAPAPAPTAEHAPMVKTTETAPVAEITHQQVGRRLSEIAAVDRERVVALLARFGCKRSSELAADQLGDFMRELG